MKISIGSALFLTVLTGTTALAGEPSFQGTEVREPCDDHEPLRQPLFGDLHVHTSYSFDS